MNDDLVDETTEDEREADLFGHLEADDALDVSNEALEGRAHEETAGDDLSDLDAEKGAVADEGDEPDVDEEPAAVEPPAEDVVEEPAFEMPAQLAGKSPEEIAKMWVDAQRAIGQKGHELGTVRQQLEAALAMDDEPAPEMLPDDAISELLDRATVDPGMAYAAAERAVELGIATPDVLEAVVDIALELDRNEGRRLERDMVSKRAQADVRREADEVLAPVRQREMTRTLQTQTQALLDDAELGADALEYRQEMGALIMSDASYVGDGTADAVARGLRKALIEARGAAPHRSAAVKAIYSKQLEADKLDAQVEAGAATNDPPLDEAEEIKKKVFARAKESGLADLWK